MGEKTGITWTDHTFNPWIGCTKVSQGCANCYAETDNKRRRWNPAGWGPGAPRHRTSKANWMKPIQWAIQAAKDGVLRRVFCASLADIFDPEVPEDWRKDLWSLIYDLWPGPGQKEAGIEWLLLTKRPENIASMLPSDLHSFSNIRIGVTAEDQENADRRIPELLKVWKGKNFISVEPMLGPVDLVKVMHDERNVRLLLDGFGPDWVICGGESGAGCRPMNLEWARDLRGQCKVAHVPFFFKQLGGYPNKRHDPAEWPEDLRVQEFPLLSPSYPPYVG